MEREERTPAEGEPPAEERGHEGEDHREGPPGYDLDEQAAIEELEQEEESGSSEQQHDA